MNRLFAPLLLAAGALLFSVASLRTDPHQLRALRDHTTGATTL